MKTRRSNRITKGVLSAIRTGCMKTAPVVAACMAMVAISTSQADQVTDWPHWLVTATFKHTGSGWRTCYQTEDLPYCEKLSSWERRTRREKGISEEDRTRALNWLDDLRRTLDEYRNDTGNTRTSGGGLRKWIIERRKQ